MNVIRAFEQFVDDVSNWYIRRSRRRFYDFDEAAFRTLWFALVQSLRVMAPVLPFLTDDLWRNLVQDGPESVHLAPWPEVVEPDRALLAEVAEVRTVVTLGRKARDEARLKHRQPLRRLVVAGAVRARRRTPTRSPRSCGCARSSSARSKPRSSASSRTCRCSGRSSAARCARCASSCSAASSTELEGGRFEVGGHVLEPDEVLVERVGVAGLVGRLRERRHGGARHARSTTTCCSRAACST